MHAPRQSCSTRSTFRSQESRELARYPFGGVFETEDRVVVQRRPVVLVPHDLSGYLRGDTNARERRWIARESASQALKKRRGMTARLAPPGFATTPSTSKRTRPSAPTPPAESSPWPPFPPSAATRPPGSMTTSSGHRKLVILWDRVCHSGPPCSTQRTFQTRSRGQEDSPPRLSAGSPIQPQQRKRVHRESTRRGSPRRQLCCSTDPSIAKELSESLWRHARCRRTGKDA